MKKPKQSFLCTNCQGRFTTWLGKCPNCAEWNTLVEATGEQSNAEPAVLSLITSVDTKAQARIKTSIKSFDAVLGSGDPGIVHGSVILLSGDPGIGKSTLLLQVASGVGKAVYFSAEESLSQLKLRCDRLDVKTDKMKFSSETEIDKILSAVEGERPDLVIIDSIQTIVDASIVAVPGSIAQVRECGWKIQRFAKKLGISFVIVGHVTKEGLTAGPKTLEHLVDTVLQLEGEKRTGLRLLRASKNRFGSLEETALWQMTSRGFEEVTDPLFAVDLENENASGRAISVAVEGARPMIVEVQALVATTPFGYPKRTVQGVDGNRLNLILAVIENKLKISFGQKDVFVNIVGGLTTRDPAIDVAIVAAIISSLKNTPIKEKLAFVGEIGLLGEIRQPHFFDKRKLLADKMGYKVQSNLKNIIDIGSILSK